MTWRMSIKAKREGAMTKFWDVLSFSMNGVIFFYVGASSANFLIR
ncbi:Na_H_Exchanger domain-containing protein [Haematococcus lacustris]|uniref:Na_H_Exchanger domain-containing protein n=2 Tax=Haematococcus lacustris TaxID=44745 RepID=A0A699ZAI4_HAELA|nr:Na_H_Exchanger domain-containing protein [Haematococcus lacustris]